MKSKLQLATFLFPLIISASGACTTFSPSDAPATDPNAEGGSPEDDGGPGGDGGRSEGGGVDPVTGLANECRTADLKTSPSCVDDRVGLFVDAANGDDDNIGSKSKPMKTLAAALAVGPRQTLGRVLVCEGTYQAALVVSRPVVIDGGFSCGSWKYTGVKPKIAPEVAGPAGIAAVTVDRVAGAVALSDLEIVALAPIGAETSSIGLSLVTSPSVTLRRMRIEARPATNGAKGDDVTAVGQHDITPNGLSLQDQEPRTCVCSSGGSTAGGFAGWQNIGGGNGGAGLPAIAGAVSPVNGAGGGPSHFCFQAEPDGTGNVGANAPPSPRGAVAQRRASVTAEGIVPSVSSDGPNGGVGQGGGGGSTGSDEDGGQGACGGCGGFGGKGGTAGGVSVAVFSFQSGVAVVDSALIASKGGDGGAGGSGAAGGPGGIGEIGHKGAGNANTCAGGAGGTGGAGGPGGGGAGGTSAGILFNEGTAHTLDTKSTVTLGLAGSPGTGGLAGLSEKIVDASTF